MRQGELLTYRPIDGVKRSEHVTIRRSQHDAARLSILRSPPVKDRGSRIALNEGHASERFMPVRYADFIRM